MCSLDNFPARTAGRKNRSTPAPAPPPLLPEEEEHPCFRRSRSTPAPAPAAAEAQEAATSRIAEYCGWCGGVFEQENDPHGPCLECRIQLCFDCAWQCGICGMTACPEQVPHSVCRWVPASVLDMRGRVVAPPLNKVRRLADAADLYHPRRRWYCSAGQESDRCRCGLGSRAAQRCPGRGGTEAAPPHR